MEHRCRMSNAVVPCVCALRSEDDHVSASTKRVVGRWVEELWLLSSKCRSSPLCGPLQYQPYFLGSILGPLIFGNSQTPVGLRVNDLGSRLALEGRVSDGHYWVSLIRLMINILHLLLYTLLP